MATSTIPAMVFTLEDRQVHAFTQEEVIALAEAFPELERTELLHGVLWEKMTKGPPHEVLKTRLNMWLARGVDAQRFEVRVEGALSVADRHSLPEPDLMVVERSGDVHNHPTVAPLVIEVAESSMRSDLRVKAPLFAATGVPEYWVVDVRRRRLLVHTQPGHDGYVDQHTHGAPEIVAPQFVQIEPLELDALFAGLD